MRRVLACIACALIATACSSTSSGKTLTAASTADTATQVAESVPGSVPGTVPQTAASSPDTEPAATTTAPAPSTTIILGTTSAVSPVPPPPVSFPATQPTIVVDDPNQVYEVITTVLEKGGTGPQACIDGELTSAPPICGGPVVHNWDWAQVPTAITMAGATYVEPILLTVTFDGTDFTETAPPRVPTDDDRARLAPPLVPQTIPCDAPAGGWDAAAAKYTPPSQTGPVVIVDAFVAVSNLVTPDPESAGWWVAHLGDSLTDFAKANDGHYEVLVAAFTDHLAEHEAALRTLWSGAICVVQRPHSTQQLQAVVTQVQSEVVAGRLQQRSYNDDINADLSTVIVPVLIATTEQQHAFDTEFGPGLVVQSPILHPVSAGG